MQENPLHPPAEAGGDKMLAPRLLETAREICPELEQRFGWVLAHVPELQQHLLAYTSEKALLQYLELMRLDGMIETHADAMSALRLFSVELLAVVLGDFTAGQLKRVSNRGTLDPKEVWSLRSLVDALQRLNKVATEMGAEAGFSKKTRHEMGVGQQNDVLDALRRIAETGEIPEAQRMGIYLTGATVRSRAVEAEEGQFSVLEGAPARVLSRDELAELEHREGGE